MSESGILVQSDTHHFETGLAKFKREADALVVGTSESCLVAKTMQRDIRAYIKDVTAKCSPFVEAAKANLQKARDELNRWTEPAQQIDTALGCKVKDFERKEREAAEAEQRRINEERRQAAAKEAEEKRKADELRAEEERKQREKEIAAQQKAGEMGKREAERQRKEAEEAERRKREQAAAEAQAAVVNVPEVKVQPNIPKVAGVPSRQTFHGTILDVGALLDAFSSAVGERRFYLRRFIMADNAEINREAKKIKDSRKLEELIPGSKGWED